MKRILVALALGVLGASCKDDTVPTGSSGTVVVHAFVDADGSGALSTGDVPITGTVTLTSQAGDKRTATLDATGAATFTGVFPGSYTATVTDTPPAGAILGGAPILTVVMPFKGTSVSASFRYVFNPGSVSGVLFKDANANGTFDAGTDTPAPGIPVALFAGTDTTATAVATTITGNAGDFSFTTVRPGAYTLKFSPIPTIQIVGGNTQTVTVTAAVATNEQVLFTGNLLTSIATARAAGTGATVAFVGVATQNAGLLASNNLYVQDATAGVLVFGAPTAGIVAGDTVRVIGAVSVFNGETEIAAPTGGTLSVTKIGTGPVPAAKTITVAQLNSGAFAGQLVSVIGPRVVNAPTGTTSYNVNFKGTAAADTFQVRVGNTTNVPIPLSFWTVGRAYNITGIDGVFNGEQQLKPRSASDVVAGAAALTIAQARALPANDTVTVIGVAYVGTGVYTATTAANLEVYIQDATGGAQIFNVPTGTTINAGDSLQVTGLNTIFDAEYEIARFSASSPPVIQVLGTGTTVQARTIGAADLATKAYDGQLVRVLGLKVVSVGTVSSSGGYNVTTTAPDGTNMTIRVDNTNVGIASTSWTVGSSYDVTGAALNFSTNNTTFTPEVKPRSAADVVINPATVVTIASAKAAANNNDTLTVEGTVTAAQGTYRTQKDNAYIQDATSGVQIFNIPASLNLVLGDVVRVHGKIVLFSGENEIENNIAVTDSIKVTRLGTGVAPNAQVISGAQFAARTFEGQLVTVQGVKVTAVGTAGGTGTYSVTVVSPDNNTFTVFMSAPAGAVPTPASTFAVGSTYDVTGIAVPFGTPSVEELKPRGAGDVVVKP